MAQPERRRRIGGRNGILAGERGLVMGVANNRSIAWGIAKAADAAGAELALHLSGRGARKARASAGPGTRRRMSSAIAT